MRAVLVQKNKVVATMERVFKFLNFTGGKAERCSVFFVMAC